MDSSGFSSPRTNFFPAGLRVLVVDDDPTWVKILEKMLKKCNYQVTTCNLAREALKLLRERKDGFDIVISDVNMPDMDGFKLLEHVGLEMDLPVIMMSVDGETSRVMKGVQHGACDYLLKPIRMKELRNIWQHVFRKRIHEVSLEEIQGLRSGAEQSDLFSGDLVSGKKRRDIDNNHGDRVGSDAFSVKRARVVWTVDLHQKFVKAVNHIGLEKVGPKKILDLMGVPWLTRENVASHLQKYRLYLSRLVKENEVKAAFGGIPPTNIPLKESSGNACLQNPLIQSTTAMQQKGPANGSYAVHGQKFLIHNDVTKNFTGNMTRVLSNSTPGPKKALFPETGDPVKDNTPRLSFNHCFGPPDSDRCSWSAGIPPAQFKQEQKPDFDSGQRFDHLPLPKPHIQFGTVDPSLVDIPGISIDESNKPTPATAKPSDGKKRSQSIHKVSYADSLAALFSVQPENNFTDSHTIDTIPNSPWNAQNHVLDQNLFDDLESSQITGTGSALKLWDEEFTDHSSQGEFFPPNAYLGDVVESLDYTSQELIADVTPRLCDSLKFDSEDPTDQLEYPLADHNPFIA